MIEGNNPTLPWMCRLDAERDRIPAVLEDHTGRLQRLAGQSTSLAARFGVIEIFDHDVVRIDQRLGRRFTRAEDMTVLAEQPS